MAEASKGREKLGEGAGRDFVQSMSQAAAGNGEGAGLPGQVGGAADRPPCAFKFLPGNLST